jgi:hypothetical protein
MINRYFALVVLAKAYPDQDPGKWRRMSNYELDKLIHSKDTKEDND